MTTAGTEIDESIAPATALSRVGALVVCAVMFVIFYYGSGWLSHLFAPYVEGIAKPADAPDTWWKVAQQFSHSGPAEVIAVFVPVWLYCLLRGRSFADLGFNRAGTFLPWVVVIAVEALLVAVELRGPIGHVGDRFNPYALYAASMIGLTAAFSEEVFFRGFLMEELRRGGFGNAAQVVISMLFFGAAHLSYIPSDIYGWTIPLGTALVGGFWSVIYIWSKRSLWPVITAHCINDFIVVAAAYYVFGGHV